MADKLPWFAFYPGDWLRDPALRRCSLAARGMWMEMLCLMFQCEERGMLCSGGSSWSDPEVAAAVGGDISANLEVLHELISKGVCTRDSRGRLLSRRLVRDEEIRKARQSAGRKGGVNKSLRNPSKRHGKPKAKVKQTYDCDSDCENEFSEFWKVFPEGRKKSKRKAHKAFQKASKRADPTAIIAAAAEYAASDEGRGQYVKMPETWLNGDCWEDDRTAWKTRRDPRGNLSLLEKYTTEVPDGNG